MNRRWRTQRRKFEYEFEIEAIRLIEGREVSVAPASRDLDVHENLLRTWAKEFAADPGQAFPATGR